jgi:hypothetical protein
MEVIDRTNHLEISHDPVENILVCRWVGFQETHKIMESGGRILKHVKERGISRVLNDNREVKGPWQEAARWAAQQWFPDMTSAGLKHFAWVLSVDIFAEISAKVAMNRTTVVKTFRTYSEAHQWLLAQE